MSAPPASVLLEHHVCERTGLSRSELDALVRARAFPKPRHSPNGARRSWTVDDVETWRRRNEWVERMRALFDAENDGMAEIDDSLAAGERALRGTGAHPMVTGALLQT